MKIKKNFLFVKKTKNIRLKRNTNKNKGNKYPIQYFYYPSSQSLVPLQNQFKISSRRLSFSNIGVTLSWEFINVYSKRKNTCKCCYNNKKNDTNSFSSDSSYIPSYQSSDSLNKETKHQILFNVSGIIYPGQCLAIMGASGSGKTTLLNALNFRTSRNFSVSGNIKINGETVSGDELGAYVGFVPQDDLFIGTLTVFEHLKFMAMLKMSKKYSRADKIKRVKDVLDEFNLTKCKDVLIGYTDKKGISGGEKRRLAFASEILTEPNILLCDEPTSGLDSHMAQMIANTIFKQAKKGKTIISVIHQPSSQVFKIFDMLCLLSEGRVAYFGERKLAYNFFASLHYVCPPMWNPSDYFIEVIASKSNNISNTQRVQAICDYYERSEYKKHLLTQIYYNKNEITYNDNNHYHHHKKVKRFQASFLTQFIYIFWRQFKSTLRESFSTRILFIQSIIIGLFLGFTYFQIKNDQSSIQNKNGLLFIILMQTCLSYLFGVANQYHNQWPVIRFEVKNKVYSIFIYYLSKTLSEVPQNILFPIITVSIVYWTSNINPNITVFGIIISIIVLTANISVGYGSFLAIIAPNIDSTVGLIGPTVLPFLIYSGFLINNKSIPVYFIWIKYISFIYYSYEAIMIKLWSNIDSINCDKSDIPIVLGNLTTISSQCLKTGHDVLDFLSIDKENFDRDIGVLIIMVVFWPVLAGVCLYIKTKLK